MIKKTFFIIVPHSIVDVITNSSSELFVFEGKEKETVEELIKQMYPNYLDEYEKLKHISELTAEELDLYIGFTCSPWGWPARKGDYPILPGFTFDELYEPEKDWKTGEIRKPAWNGEIQYRLKQNDHCFVTDENKEEIINRMDPEKKCIFFFRKMIIQNGNIKNH